MSTQRSSTVRGFSSRMIVIALLIGGSTLLTAPVWPLRNGFGWALYVVVYAIIALVSLGMGDSVRTVDPSQVEAKAE